MTAIQKRKVKLIVVAADAAERTKKNFRDICHNNQVSIIEILTIEELSNSIGKDNKAIIGISDSNFSNEILKISGGEVIG